MKAVDLQGSPRSVPEQASTAYRAPGISLSHRRDPLHPASSARADRCRSWIHTRVVNSGPISADDAPMIRTVDHRLTAQSAAIMVTGLTRP